MSAFVRVGIMGATPDTANLGVSALYESILSGLSSVIPDLEVVVFDNQFGCREEQLEFFKDRPIRVIKYGARGGFRYYRPENLLNMLFCSRLGAFGSRINDGVRLLKSCDVVVDISGGDSFSDIYGIKRFLNMYRQKMLVLNLRKPLVLLPQTYGPYKSEKVFEKASRVAKRARLAWARDQHSYEVLKKLLGSCFKPEVHMQGIDVAFGLKPALKKASLSPELESLLCRENRIIPVAGINISGLIYNDPVSAQQRYGLKTNYKHLMIDLVNAFLENTQCHVLLVPHVVENEGHFESDLSACEDLADTLSDSVRNRILIAPGNLTASEAKGLIAKLDWFCGTRMHSTIAALSSGVPTATIVYSDKARGVFASCNQEEFVFDPRKLPADKIVEGVISAFNQRDSTREELDRVADQFSNQAMDTFRRISELVEIDCVKIH